MLLKDNFLQNVIPNFKNMQPTPSLPLHPIPLINCGEMVVGPSNESNNIEIYSIQDTAGTNSSTSNNTTLSKTLYPIYTSTNSTSINNASCVLNNPNIYNNTSMTPSLNPQLETFSNSIGSGFSNFQCVNPTEVHIDGYLSPTNRSSEESRNISPCGQQDNQQELPSTSQDLTSRIPSNIDCSNVDFASVNEELLSPANFSTYDNIPLGQVSSSKMKNSQAISSTKDVPVFSIPEPMIGSSSKRDLFDNPSSSPMQDSDEGAILHSPMKTVCAGQKFIDMGVEFHMMLQKQNFLKKQANSSHHHDRLVPISSEVNDESERDVDDDDEIVDNFNWDKLL